MGLSVFVTGDLNIGEKLAAGRASSSAIYLSVKW